MKFYEVEELLKTEDYDFLRNDNRFGDNIILMTYGGSYAYGTNNENSDIDIRGCAVNSKREILTGQDYEQFVDEKTDTTIYSFNKLIKLLCSVNPNTIEMLGCKAEHYFVLSDMGKQLIENRKIFLSKQAVYSFGGYANQQLRRLDNKAARLVSQSENEKHILKTINHVAYTFGEKYFDMPQDAIKMYIDKAIQKDFNTEIFMDINLKHYPLRDYKCMMSELQNILKSYTKIGKRNANAISHNKLGKHMMHLIRLYMMCLDILEREEIVTYREKEHDFLMDIRNGKYLDDNSQPTAEFKEIIDDFEKRLEYAAANTALPEKPDLNRINDFMEMINEQVVKK